MAQDTMTGVIDQLFACFNAGDLDGAAALVTEDFELVDIPTGMQFSGPDGLRQWLGAFLAAGPDARTEVHRTIASGDWIATEHTGRFTHTGPLMTPNGPIEATGRRVELAIAEFYQLRGGKLRRLHAYYDIATILRQIGAL